MRARLKAAEYRATALTTISSATRLLIHACRRGRLITLISPVSTATSATTPKLTRPENTAPAINREVPTNPA